MIKIEKSQVQTITLKNDDKNEPLVSNIYSIEIKANDYNRKETKIYFRKNDLSIPFSIELTPQLLYELQEALYQQWDYIENLED